MTPSVAETLAALKAARKRIERPENWTQSVFARDASGKAVDACAPEAVCWCILGALKAEPRVMGWGLYNTCEILGQRGALTVFNDTHEHPEVLALFDRAIERIERLELNA